MLQQGIIARLSYAVELATQIAGLTCLCPIRARVGDKLFYSWLEGQHHVPAPWSRDSKERHIFINVTPLWGWQAAEQAS